MFLITAVQVVAGHIRLGRPRYETVFGVLLGLSQLAPMTIGAVLLHLGRSGGLAWLAAGLVVTLVSAMLNAWVLLVEILR